VSSRRRARAVLALAGLTVCLSVSARADVSTSGLLTAEYLYNTDEEASVSEARLELDLWVGDFTIGAVYRAYQLSDPGYNPAGVEIPLAEIKHRYAEYDSGDLLLRGGNFFVTFGRGLTLRSYEEVELEYDTVLDGLLGEYRAGPVTVTALAGTATDDEAGTGYVEHAIRGGRASARPLDWLGVAASAVERITTQKDEDVDIPDELARDEDVVLGGELDLWLGRVTFGGEYAGRNGENPVTGGDEVQGHATYASATLDLDWVTLFGEVKDYDDFDHYVVNPPTCVRDHLWTLMNRATYVVNLNDERGFLVEGTAPVAGAYVTGGASEARRHSGDLAHWEIFGQYEQTFGEGIMVSAAGSWSREYLFSGATSSGKFTEHTIAAGDVEFPVGDSQLVELSLEGQRIEDTTGDVYDEYLGAAAWYPSHRTTITAVVEKTTHDVGPDEPDVWLMVDWKQLLADDLEVTLSVGTQRGGKKCTGGVCYIEPEFEGARMRLTKYF